MNPVLIISLTIVWLYVLRVFSKAKMYEWRFLWGSMGMFVLMMIILEPLLTDVFARCVAALAGLLGQASGTFSSYFKYGIIFIETLTNEAITLRIDFECSGIIEIMAFVALLTFFNVYSPSEKLMVGIAGFSYIMISNALRITIICIAVHFGGVSTYYVMHTFVGRIFFYIMSILLYFYVFTYSQIKRMKVGSFDYGHSK